MTAPAPLTPGPPATVGQRVAALAGLILTVAGLIVGLTGVSSSAGTGSHACGAAFGSDEARAAAAADQFVNGLGVGGSDDPDPAAMVASCEAARSSRRTVAVVLLVAGGIAGVGGWLAFRRPGPVDA